MFVFLVVVLYSSHSSNDGRRQSSSNASFGPRYDGNNKTNRVNRVKGGPNRDLDTLMELQMNKVSLQWCYFILSTIFG